MKLFQQLLVAPAALGLLAPLAVVNSPSVNAAELNINGVADDATFSENSIDQVTSVSQLSDVYPTDWAYQALSNLVETYGCVTGYPNGTFRGNRAMTRYEAAALLNACLDRVTEMTDELKRLIREFETELAILKGKVDGLEGPRWRTGSDPVLHHYQTQGLATFVVGANRFNGSANRLRSDSNADAGGAVFNGDLQLAVETSFSGRDQLTTVLRAGNFDPVHNAFGSGGPSGLATLETAFQEEISPSSS